MHPVIPTWVITRAQPEADQDVATLREKGIVAVAVPCIERVPLPWPEWNPVGKKIVLVSSTFGALALAKAWPSMQEPRPLVAAMAPATAARLEADGIPIEVRAEGGIVALARALKDWHQSGRLAVLFATSDVGTGQPEQAEALALMSSFAFVERVAVYSTRAPVGLEQKLLALEPPVSFVFMSPSAVEQAVSLTTLVPAAVACIGQSTYRRYRELAPTPTPTHHSSFGAFVTAHTPERS